MGVSYREQLRRRIPCLECGVEVTDGSMMAHWIRIYGTETEIYWNWLMFSQMEKLPYMYSFRFPKNMTHCPCPLTGLPGSSHTFNGPRDHFNWQHWGDSIIILEEQPYPFPKCDHYRS